MRKFLALIAIFIASESFALDLPDKIQNWHLLSEDITPLTAGNKNFGRVVYRSYLRTSPRGTLDIILTEGSGAGNLYVPECMKDSEGLFRPASDYVVLNISQKRAILERSETLPLVLAIKAGDNITLTIETHALNESELINFAGDLLSNVTK
ncbi:MAG: hypothetical protein IJT21_05830 [Synergistaceae bacterium]|nr:hypothetical protein [Synergistaceae bacterium]